MKSYELFSLKEFSLCQAHTPMKLGTDALALGAWTSLNVRLESNTQVLDIGAGTGILSLMLAQNFTNATIDAIELDTGAIRDATENFKLSPWYNRLNLLEGDILEFSTAKKYALIISNPPFYDSMGLRAGTDGRIRARQEQMEGLNIRSLIKKAKELLDFRGRLFLILPYERESYLRQIACEELMFIDSLCRLYSKPDSPVRTLVCLSSLLEKIDYEETIISRIVQREFSGEYTSQWRKLLAPYLKL